MVSLLVGQQVLVFHHKMYQSLPGTTTSVIQQIGIGHSLQTSFGMSLCSEEG